MIEEEWTSITESIGYDISNMGRVRSYHIHRGKKGTMSEFPQRILKPIMCNMGYLAVGLKINGSKKVCQIHRLVARYFIGPCPEGQEVRHVDGNRINNTCVNLCYGTHYENMHDMINMGRLNSKLNKDQVKRIRREYSNDPHDMSSIAREYNVCRKTIQNIVNGPRSWKDIE